MDIQGTAPSTPSAAFDPSVATPVQSQKKRGRGRSEEQTHAGLSGKRVDITLHDSDRIPPGGQFIGVNGQHFLLMPGHRANVPVELLSVLDDAVMTEPVLNEKLQVEGYRNVPRLTYTLHRDSE